MSTKLKQKTKKVFDVLWTIFLITIVIGSTGFAFYRLYFEHIYVTGQSMYPTLNNSERVPEGWHDYGIIDSTTAAKKKLKRFDIITCYYPWDSGDYEQPYNTTLSIKTTADAKIKRVIALPGETLEIKNGEYFINGVLVEQNRFNYYVNPLIPISFYNIGPVTMGEGRYFVMGDNWTNSNDCASISHILYGGIYFENIDGVLKGLDGICQVNSDGEITKIKRTTFVRGKKL